MSAILYLDDRSRLSALIRLYLGNDPGISIDRIFSPRVALQKLAKNEYQGIICTPGIEGADMIRSRADERAVSFLAMHCNTPRVPVNAPLIVTIDRDHCSLEFCLYPGGDQKSQVTEIVRYILQCIHAGEVPAAPGSDTGVLHTIVQDMRISFGILVNNSFEWVNPDCANLLGYTQREMRGKQIRELFADEGEYIRFWRDAGGKRDAAGWGRADVELAGKGSNGIPVRIRLHRINPTNPTRGHILLFEDLSGQDRAGERLKEEHRAWKQSAIQYQETLETMHAAIIRADLEGDICYFNGKACEVFGYVPEEVLGRNIVGTLVSPGSRNAREMITLLNDVTSGTGEHRLHAFENQKKDGQLFWMAWNTLPLRDPEGRITEVLLVGQDITGHDFEGKRAICTNPWKYQALEGTDVLEEVFDRVFHISIEISREGRESKRIGTSFVIGDTGQVMSHSRQCAINAFGGVPEDQRRVQQPENKENLKNFAQLDGAFVIRGDGVIIASSRHFTVEPGEVDLPMGYGTRHAAVAGITKKTKSVGIVVSESGGTITVFRGGAIVKQVVT